MCLMRHMHGHALSLIYANFARWLETSLGSLFVGSSSMAPKRQIALAAAPIPLRPEPPVQEALPAPRPVEAARPARRKRSMTACQFVGDVAQEADSTAKQVKTILRAAHAVVSRELSADGDGPGLVGIPGICKLVVKVQGPRQESEKLAFGKRVTIPARAARRVIKASPAKSLRDTCLAF